MARRVEEYVADILGAIAAIRLYTRAGKREFVNHPMARDAVIARIIQIGEAVKGAQAGGLDLEELEPDVPWRQIAGMRDLLSHQYWRTDPGIVWAVAAKDLKPLQASAKRILAATAGRSRKAKTRLPR